jgi:Tol biopolymer transport system component
MTGQRSPEERIALWLEQEAVGQLPDHTLEATFARTRAIRNRPGPSLWRLFPMSRPVTTLLAVGAAAIVIVVGVNALRPPSTPVVGASPSVSVAPSVGAPTTSPFASIGSPITPLGAAIVGLDGTIHQDLGLPRSAWAPAVSPDGSRVAYVDGGRLWIAPVTPGDVPTDTGASVSGKVPEFGTFPVDAAPAWSPDGSKIAYASDGDIYLVGASAGEQPQRLTTDPALDEWPAWSSDGRFIYYVNQGTTPLDGNAISTSQELWRVPAVGGTPKRITRDDVAEIQPDFAHNGSMLVWAGGGVVAMNATNGQTSDLRNTGDGAVITMPDGWNPRWSPDGSKVAVLVYQGDRANLGDPSLGIPDDLPAMEIVIVDLKTGASTTVGPRVAAFWNPVSWMPDSRSLLVNRFDDGT